MRNRKQAVVPVETVDVGDVAGFAWRDGDVTRTARGLVVHIDRAGHDRIFLSESGQEIARYDVTKPSQVICTMFERYTPLPPTLFEMETV